MGLNEWQRDDLTTNVSDKCWCTAGRLLDVCICTQCTRLVVEWMHLNEVSRIYGQERVWSLENCMKCKFMYKAVDKKKISAGIGCMIGRKVYTSKVTWSWVWRCSKMYSVLRGDKNANKHRKDESWDQSKITFKLIISKNHITLHIVIAVYISTPSSSFSLPYWVAPVDLLHTCDLIPTSNYSS